MQTLPFTRGYVLRLTLKHIRQAIDASIAKTVNRIKEFEGDSVKSTEILNTLNALYALKRIVDDFYENNKSLFN